MASAPPLVASDVATRAALKIETVRAVLWQRWPDTFARTEADEWSLT
jgi:hypothetical protein